MSSLKNLSSTLRAIIIGLALLCLVIGYLIGSSRSGFNGGPEHLSETYLDIYVSGLASRFNQDQNPGFVQHAMCYGDAQQAVQSRLDSGALNANPGVLGAYQQVIGVVTQNGGCPAYRAAVDGTTAAETGGAASGILGMLLRGLLGILLLALIIGGLAWFFMRQRSEVIDRPSPERIRREDDNLDWENAARRDREYETLPEMPAAEEYVPEVRSSAVDQTVAAPVAPPPVKRNVDPGTPQPIGGFSTTYNRGDDAFDKSFIIENSNGDFLGECGVSISEYVTTDDGARNVTAFEIWLFDKNDTHTVTKVLMSDHAFSDEATRAKLAVRGESVLASRNETVALETNALIINANVKDLRYTDTSPARGVFDRFTIDLSAWVKSPTEQSSGSGASDLLNF